MKMLQTICDGGKWMDYCHVGILTDIKDSNNEFLSTGDIVKIIDVKTYAKINQIMDCEEAVIVFDQFDRFLNNTKFYVEGWFKVDWESDDCPYILVKQNRTFETDGRLRIVKV